MKMCKSLVFIAIGLVLAASASAQSGPAPSALSVVTQSRNRIKADTVSTRSRMIRGARNGTTSEQVIDQYSKKDSDGNNRTVITFQTPATVRGTRFLTTEKPGRDNEQWIFLPSLGKVRRIAASEGSGSFMGTDFSYDDISSAERNADLDTHRILREEALGGRDCYVIESVPKSPDYQYSKMIQWIEKGSFINHKVELYDRRDTLVKILEILEIREVQGRQTAMVTRMTTPEPGTSTSINIGIIKYDDTIPESVFTTNYLETGRP